MSQYDISSSSDFPSLTESANLVYSKKKKKFLSLVKTPAPEALTSTPSTPAMSEKSIDDDYLDDSDIELPDLDFSKGADINISGITIAPEVFAELAEPPNVQLQIPKAGELFDEIYHHDTFDSKSKMTNVLGHSVKNTHYTGVSVPPGIRVVTRPSMNPFAGANITLTISDMKVWANGENGSYEIGVSKFDGFLLLGSVTSEDFFKKADKYTTMVGGKGSRLGFSSFVHLTGMLILSTVSPTIIEPPEGWDLTFIDFNMSVEMTGSNYKIRDTSATLCISKYLLISAVVPEELIYSDFIELSIKEDLSQTDGFNNSSFSQPKSPYTEYISDFHSILEKMTDEQMSMLGKQLLSYESNLPVFKPTQINRNFNIVEIENYIKESSKHGLYPAPYRVLSHSINPTLSEDVILQRQRYEPTDYLYTSSESAYSYHTITFEQVDTFSNLEVTESLFGLNSDFESMFVSSIYKMMSKKAVFNTVLIEQELLSKICGSSGQFYSKYSFYGIRWSKKSETAYNCFYYTFEQPPESKLVGQWCFDGQAWQSPHFITSATDIAYSICLPGRIFASMQACMAIVPLEQSRVILERLLPLYTTWIHSSWLTSSIAGNMRHIVTCHMAYTGDLPELFSKSLVRGKSAPLRYCDLVLVKRLLDYAKNYDHVHTDQTPLFKLPRDLLSMEKDIAIPMQWHIRKANHDNDSVMKLINGQKEERRVRSMNIQWLKHQKEFLDLIPLGEASQDEFNKMMKRSPDHPFFNFPLYIALVSLARKSISHIGSHQESTGFSMANLVSDHNNIHVFDGSTLSWSNTKVANEFAEMCKTFKPNGAYHLLTQIARGQPVKYVYSLFSKDAKSGDREIPVMSMPMRVIQCFSEAMISPYCQEVESDLMIDSAKHTKVVLSLAKYLHCDVRAVSSQDKKFFGGNLYPEMMSLAVECVGRVAGSTSLISAASVLRQNTSRLAVMPDDFTNEHLLSDLDPIKTLHYKRNKTTQMQSAVYCFQHMMQGVGAAAAALFNTTFYLGVKRLQELMSPFIVNQMTYTTSDDTISMFEYEKGRNLRACMAESIQRPISLLKEAMMVNSSNKQVDSYYFGEFNNRVTFASGMSTVDPIYASLGCEPLNQPTPLGDIIQLCSGVRQILFWGGSIDGMQSAYVAQCFAFKQKWLVNDSELSNLKTIGLLPTNTGELIEGFYPRSRLAVGAMWNALRESDRIDLLNHEINITHAFTRISNYGRKEPVKLDVEGYVDFNINEMFSGINTSRALGARLNLKNVRLKDRKLRHQSFLDMMTMLQNNIISDEIFNKIELEFRPFKAMFSFRRTSNFTKVPMSMGTSTKIDDVSLKRVIAWRFFKFNYRTLPSEDEIKIASSSNQEFLVWYRIYIKSPNRKGFSFKSPSGLPRVRCVDSKFFQLPMSFNFFFVLPPSKKVESIFTHHGRPVVNLKPCFWGALSLQSVPLEDSLAFATGEMDGVKFTFYQIGPEVRRQEIFSSKGFVTEGSRKIHYITEMDWSPLLVTSERLSVISTDSGFTGDHNAIANYGQWIRSSMSTAFGYWSEFYRNRNSRIPSNFQQHMMPYPTFHPNAINIEQTGIADLTGCRSIALLRMVTGPNRRAPMFINLMDKLPKLTVPSDFSL